MIDAAYWFVVRPSGRGGWDYRVVHRGTPGTYTILSTSDDPLHGDVANLVRLHERYPNLSPHDAAAFGLPNWAYGASLTPDTIFMHPTTFSSMGFSEPLRTAMRLIAEYDGVDFRDDTRRAAASLLGTQNADGTIRARIVRAVTSLTDADAREARRTAEMVFDTSSFPSFSVSTAIRDVPRMIRGAEALRNPALAKTLLRRGISSARFYAAVRDAAEVIEMFSDGMEVFTDLVLASCEGVDSDIAQAVCDTWGVDLGMFYEQ